MRSSSLPRGAAWRRSLRRWLTGAPPGRTTWLLALWVAGSAAAEVKLLATIEHPGLNEISGITASRRYPDRYWVHNDSGDEARLFAITLDGKVVFPDQMRAQFAPDGGGFRRPWPGIAIHNAWHVDWEDITRVGDTLYVADVGNNSNGRRDLGIYVLTEPNPHVVRQTRALRFIPIIYPDQAGFPGRRWEYDSEALFADGNALFLLTKHRRPGEPVGFAKGTKLYQLISRELHQENRLRLVGRHQAIGSVTAAELAPTGQHLAVLTYDRLWVFPRPAPRRHWLSGPPATIELAPLSMGLAEGVTWSDDDTMIIATEGGRLYQVERSSLVPYVAPPRQPGRPANPR